MKSSIITNKNVDKTFAGEDCLLRRTIINKRQKNCVRTYNILTEKVKYEDVLLPSLDEKGDVQFDENGELIESLQSTLKVIEQKDSISDFVVTDIDADILYNAIKANISLGESYSEFERSIETMALLYVTQSTLVWGTSPNDWEIYNQ